MESSYGILLHESQISPNEVLSLLNKPHLIVILTYALKN